MRRAFTAFLQDASGSTSIEYALIATGIALVILAAVTAIGASLNATFTGFAGV